MESTILDDASHSKDSEAESRMRNNINRANNTVYSQYALIGVTTLVLLTNIYFLINVSDLSIFSEDNPVVLTQIGLSLINVVVLIVSLVLFFKWFRRAYKNIQLIGYKTEYKDGWAVGWFFVPFANLVMPYNIMTEIWRKMKLTSEGNDIKHHLSIGYGWWWLFWVVSNMASYVAIQITDVEGTVYLSIVTNVLDIISAVLTIVIVQQIRDTEQELRQEGGF